MCHTYDKSKVGDTKELQSRVVPPKNNWVESPYSVTGPINGSEAAGDLVLIKTYLWMATWCKIQQLNIHTHSRLTF